MQRDDILFSLNKFSANRLEILTKTSCTLLEYSHWNDQEHFFRKARPNACSVAVRLKLVCTTRLLLLERTNSVRTRSHVVCVCVCELWVCMYGMYVDSWCSERTTKKGTIHVCIVCVDVEQQSICAMLLAAAATTENIYLFNAHTHEHKSGYHHQTFIYDVMRWCWLPQSSAT